MTSTKALNGSIENLTLAKDSNFKKFHTISHDYRESKAVRERGNK